MKIGLVCPYDLLIPGGVQNQVELLAKFLHKNGHFVVVCHPGLKPYVSSFWDASVAAGHVLKIPVNGSVAPVSFDLLNIARALKILHDYQLDVLHLHEPFAPGASYGVLIKKEIPLVATFHRNGVDLLYKLAAPLLKSLARKLDYSCFVSSSAFNTANYLFDVNGEILFNAIDISEFEGHHIIQQIDPSPNDVKVMFFGRHEKRKGLGLLLEAFLDMPSWVSLKVVGQGPQTEGLKARYKKLVNVSWLGELPRNALIAELNSSDIVAIPSYSGESFGLSLLESMAAGKAVIASDLASYREVAGDCVYYFKPGDVTSLKNSLIELANSNDLRDELARRARMKAKNYDITVLVNQYEKIYETVING